MTGDELKARRKELDLKQDELAEKLGVARNTVSRWELEEMAIPPFLELALKQLEAEQKQNVKG